MRESKLKIPTTDSKIIYGVINRPEQATDRLIVMVHGITCDSNSHPFPMAAAGLVQEGYAVIRYDQYSGNHKGRNILECNTNTFCNDLLTVIKFIKKPKQKIFLIGHSWGGLQVMQANPTITAASLWEPSYAVAENAMSDGLSEKISNNRILLHWGTAQAMNCDLYAEFIHLSKAKSDQLAKQIKFPIQIIHGRKGMLYKKGSYHQKTKQKTDYQLLNAGHCFEELSVVPKLIKHTVNWFNNF